DAMRRRGGAFDVSGFSGVNRAVQAVAIRRLLSERMGSLRRISRAHIEAVRQLILEGGPSDSIDLPGGWRAEREYNFFRLVHSRAGSKTGAAVGTAAGFSVAIAADGITVVEAAGFNFEASTIAAADLSMPDTSFSLVAMFDAAKIADAGLVARNFMKGDRMHPMGMRGTRKVHDVFVDGKLPRASRERFPVVTVGGEIAWLPGLARADCALVTKATETILRVEASAIAA
ncbi:MAG: tRNA lysidine(34) synthetase TilS, partial [Candidatus Binatus sp.]